MSNTSTLESVLRRDRMVVATGLGLITVLAWLYILLGAGMGMSALDMTFLELPMLAAGGGSPGDMAMQIMPWTIAGFAIMVVMWWVMMIAMMVPSAAPMILLYARVSRKQAEKGGPALPTGVFALGYLVMWGTFSVAATALQWGLEQLFLISPMMASVSTTFGGIVLVGAGLYQLTPLKYACLEHCRSPLHFLSHGFRKGTWGAFRMGAEHGVYCLGCCWVLMALLFVGGVMNLLWIAGIAIFVLAEKLLPFGHHTSRVTGVLLAIWGVWVLAQG